jgi:glycosyltransferase involved in cell wall biosynthesis
MGFQRSTKHEVGYRIMGRYFDKVLCVSERVRQRCLQTEGLSPSRVLTLYNGINLSQVDSVAGGKAFRSTLGIPADAPLITTVGNMRWIKGTDLLIHAAEQVCRLCPNAIFLVVGEVLESGYFQHLNKLVASLGLDRNVIFAGARDDVYSILKCSNVFCLPSRSEGFSNALIEAMACALPAVATDVGGNSEAILDGKTGFLVQPENPERLANRLVHLIDFPAKARSLGQAGRRIVEQRFTCEAMMTKLIGVYDELLTAKSE